MNDYTKHIPNILLDRLMNMMLSVLNIASLSLLIFGFHTSNYIDRSAVHLFERFNNFDMSLTDDCFKQIDSIHFDGASNIYKNRIEEIIKMTSEIEI